MIRAGLVALPALLALATPAPAVTAADRDCADFADQAAAQRFFIAQGGPESDPHHLDGVGPGNGVACESLPCPCSRKRGQAPPSKPRPRQKRIPATVVSHVDGDTIKVRERGSARRGHTVRLIGIDTPETKRPGVGIECGGPEGSESMVDLVPAGAKILLRTDPSQQTHDRHGRLLAYVQRKGRDVGRAQIRRGWATTYVYGGKPFRRVEAYRRAAMDAIRAGRGVHERCGGDFHL